MHDYSDTTVIIPTLNEGENISSLLRRILYMHSGISIIVADDGSTDATKEAVGLVSGANPRVRLLDRSAARTHGLTASVISAALEVGTPKTIVMDGDMQHPPDKIAPMAAALDRCDIVVGVRTSVRNWGIHRKALSKGMTAISMLVFTMKGKQTTNDMMSGFFGIRTRLLKRLVYKRKSEFVHEGYKVLLDILRMVDRSTRIEEVPYSTFHRRRKGRSKFLPKHVVTTLMSALK